MNKLLILILAGILPVTSFAKPNEESCRNLMTYAKYVILKKQNGTPLDEFLNENDNLIIKWSVPEKKIANTIIQEAYRLPNYNNSEFNKEQRNKFIADQYIACKKNMK